MACEQQKNVRGPSEANRHTLLDGREIPQINAKLSIWWENFKNAMSQIRWSPFDFDCLDTKVWKRAQILTAH